MCGSGSHSNSTPKGRKHPFLQRSDSTLCLGCPPLDPFDTVMSEALPLADQPHLLQPHSRREDLFGIPRQPTSAAGGSSQNPLEGLPTRLGLSARGTDSQNSSATPTFSQVVQGPLCNLNLESRRNSVSAGELNPSSVKYAVIIRLLIPRGFILKTRAHAAERTSYERYTIVKSLHEFYSFACRTLGQEAL